MEQLINFMEQYWGVTVVGGITVGTIFTFIIVQVRFMLKDKKKNVIITTLLTAAENVIGVNHQDELEKQKLIAHNEYMQKSQALLFKYIQYLTIASKLPIEEKQALQAETFGLVADYKDVVATFAQGAVAEIAADLIAGEKIEAADILEIAAEGAKSLLDKYTEKEE